MQCGTYAPQIPLVNNQIVRGVIRQNPNVNVVRVQDVGLSEADDPTVLEWAAQQGRTV